MTHMRCSRRSVAACVAITAAAIATSVTAANAMPGNTTLASYTLAPTTANAHAAVAYGEAHNLTTSVSIWDRQATVWHEAGPTEREYSTASVAKVMIARCLMAKSSWPTFRTRARTMIEQSDDNLANYLWGVCGEENNLEQWIESHYNISDLGGNNERSGWWGNIKVTSHGLVRLYAAIYNDHGTLPGGGDYVNSWMVWSMAHITHYAADGTDQYFGIPHGASVYALKQGWCAYCGGNAITTNTGAILNTTGFVSTPGTTDHRYIVVILSVGHDNAGQANSKGIVYAQREALNQEAYIALT